MPPPFPIPATTACPPDSILSAVAAGRVPDPLLGVYLEHVETCDACCARIEREAADVLRLAPVGQPAAAGPAIDRWLARLKRATPTAACENESLEGGTIGRFRIVGRLGVGGSSVVYEAIDEDLDRPVVLKVLREVHDDLAEQHRLVVTEARVLAAVRHDSIMPLLQLLWHDGAPVLVFPRLPGETLADALAARRVGLRQALAIIRDVARGLAYTHDLGIFHHDVKPSNIWLEKRLDGQESARLFDFGLAGTPTIAAGTPGYADPETAATGEPEPRDLFSLGVVLHECLAAAPNAPPAYRDLVRRLTSPAPADRPRAAAVAAEIDRLLEPPRPAWLAAAAGAVVAAGILMTWGLGFMRAAPPPAAGIRVAGTGPIAADVVAPGAGSPAALSADGRTLCVATDGPALRIRPIDSADGGSTVPLGFRPDRLAFNAMGDRLAAADVAGNLVILDLPAAVTATHRFEKGIAWIGWAGWQRDIVFVLSGDEVHAFFKTWKGGPVKPQADWQLNLLRGGVQAVATLPGTEGVVSMGLDGKVTMWSAGHFTADTPIPLPAVDVVRLGSLTKLGWKSRGVCFVVLGQTVVEFAPYHGVRSFQTPTPVESIVWPTETHYVFTTVGPGDQPRVILGNSARPGWSRELVFDGEDLPDLVLLDDSRVAAIGGDGGVRIYSVPGPQ